MPLSDIARAAEDRLHRETIPLLKARGWRPRVIAYDGYGSAAPGPAPRAVGALGASARPEDPESPGAPARALTAPGDSERSGRAASSTMARILARMVLRPANAPAEGPLFRSIPDEIPTSASEMREVAIESLLDAQRGWRLFIDVPVPYLPVTIEFGRARVRTRADRSGYVDVVVRDHGLEAGWHEARITAAGARTVTSRVRIIPPGPRLGVISDIDDTAMVSNVPRVFIAAWNLLVKNASNREPVPGMAEMLSRIDELRPNSPLIFLSTGAWNAVPTLNSFFRKNGFPPAPKLMTDWGPTHTGWFRSGIEHKRTELRRLLIDLPDVRWLLIGDDGQHDPLIYAEVVREHSDRVAAVAIRRLSQKEQVLAGSSLVNPMGIGPEARMLAEADVPVATGRDGFELARALPDWITRP